MSNNFIKYAFLAGELNPKFFGRTDLTQYDMGLAEAKNWFVDYRGGLANRSGLEFLDMIEGTVGDTIKFVRFAFSTDTANTYNIVFGDGYIRFFQAGEYVLESSHNISGITKGTNPTVSASGTGFSAGDWVHFGNIVGMPQLSNRTVRVQTGGSSSFTFRDLFGNAVDTTNFTTFVSGTVARIYTLDNPYDLDELDDLSAENAFDYVRLTHVDHPIRNLIRNDHADWDIVEESLGNDMEIVSGLGATGSKEVDTDHPERQAGIVFTITWVDKDGNESLPAQPFIKGGIVNYAIEEGNCNIFWNSVDGAVYYNIYRSFISAKSSFLGQGQGLGFLGRSTGTQFTDFNIIPDFGRTPPQYKNPFAPGQIETIDVTAPGTSYGTNLVAGISGGGGTGAIINYQQGDGTTVGGIKVVKGGEGYTSQPTITISDGTGATFNANIGPLTGTYPRLSAIFQQRQIYASTDNEPMGIWGSQPGAYNNFDYSVIAVDSDSIEYTLDANEVSPIQHMIAMRGGLLLMTQTGIFQLYGGGNGQNPLTPSNALADPQSYTGVSKVRPIKVGTDLMYSELKDSTVRLLSYNDISKVYAGEDHSILSSHLMGSGNPIVSWDYAESPYKCIYAATGNGRLLAFTCVPEQKIYGWCPWETRGYVRQVITIQEDAEDWTYLLVDRYINGHWVMCYETITPRELPLEDGNFLDCSSSLGGFTPNATLSIAPLSSGAHVLTTSSSVLGTGTIGQIVRVGGGKLRITASTGNTNATAEVLEPLTDMIPQDPQGRFPPYPAGTWTLDVTTTSITGLWWLVGETVSALVDGNVVEGLTVGADGGVDFGVDVTRAIVGLPYQSRARNLPPTVSDTVIEGRKKRIVGVAVRLDKSRGLKMGPDMDSLYEMRDRQLEIPGEPTRPRTGMTYDSILPDWDENGQTYFVQDYPLPAAILGWVVDAEVGDDPN